MMTPGDDVTPITSVIRRVQTTVTGSPHTHVSRRKRRVFRSPGGQGLWSYPTPSDTQGIQTIYKSGTRS